MVSANVVSHFISTSNHNWATIYAVSANVVSHFISTSNHNEGEAGGILLLLLVISFLHQTTTDGMDCQCACSC